MNKFTEEKIKLQRKLLSTEVSDWKRKIFLIVYSVFSTIPFISLILIMQDLTKEGKDYFTSGLVFGAAFFISELVLIWHFYKSTTIPRYVRDAFSLMYILSNLWLTLFIIHALLRYSH